MELHAGAVQAVADLVEDLAGLDVHGLMGGLIGELALAHGLDLAPQLVQFGLTGHLVEAGAELIGHASQLADPLADLAQHDRQVLRPDDDQRDDRDDDVFEPTDFGKHALS